MELRQNTLNRKASIAFVSWQFITFPESNLPFFEFEFRIYRHNTNLILFFFFSFFSFPSLFRLHSSVWMTRLTSDVASFETVSTRKHGGRYENTLKFTKRKRLATGWIEKRKRIYEGKNRPERKKKRRIRGAKTRSQGSEEDRGGREGGTQKHRLSRKAHDKKAPHQWHSGREETASAPSARSANCSMGKGVILLQNWSILRSCVRISLSSPVCAIHSMLHSIEYISGAQICIILSVMYLSSSPRSLRFFPYTISLFNNEFMNFFSVFSHNIFPLF